MVDDETGLFVVDMQDPTSPQRLDWLNADYLPTSEVVVQGQYAYLTEYGSALEPSPVAVVDISQIPIQLVDLVWFNRQGIHLALDEVTSTAWLTTESALHGLRVGCATCEGVTASSALQTIFTGGETSTVTVTVRDDFGNLAPWHTVSATASIGRMDDFADHLDGTYSGMLVSDDRAGWADVTRTSPVSQVVSWLQMCRNRRLPLSWPSWKACHEPPACRWPPVSSMSERRSRSWWWMSHAQPHPKLSLSFLSMAA